MSLTRVELGVRDHRPDPPSERLVAVPWIQDDPTGSGHAVLPWYGCSVGNNRTSVRVGQDGGVEAYNPRTSSWTPVAPMLTGRDNLAATTGLDGRIYAIGGRGFNAYLTMVEAYTPSTNTWTRVAAMPTAAGPCSRTRPVSEPKRLHSGHIWIGAVPTENGRAREGTHGSRRNVESRRDGRQAKDERLMNPQTVRKEACGLVVEAGQVVLQVADPSLRPAGEVAEFALRETAPHTQSMH